MGHFRDDDETPMEELRRLLNDIVQPDKASDAGRYAELNNRAAQRLKDLGFSRDEVSRLSIMPEKPGGNQ